MRLTKNKAEEIKKEYGDSFYILDIEQFEQNYDQLNSAFNNVYPNTQISYSYKTNYIPKLCKSIFLKNGYAEVVSDMEYKIARRIGVPRHMIVFNGPWKDSETVKELILHGGIVNLDSLFDFFVVKKIAEESDKKLKIGIRINFDIGDNVVSRFGFDPTDEDFKTVINYIMDDKTNIELCGIHLHFASRNLKYWPSRAEQLINLIETYGFHLDYFSLGGGMFGKMEESLKMQFDTDIPSYEEYANAVCPNLKKYFDKKGYLPKMFIEPGSALVGDCMKFIAPVVSIKKIRGSTIATLLGSIYNINPTLNTKNPSLEILHLDSNKNVSKEFHDVNFGGFTCIENDYLYKGYNGSLAIDDLAVFGNVGSYSIVLKPPFILPNFPVVSIHNNKVELIKRKETFEDLFQSYVF